MLKPELINYGDSGLLISFSEHFSIEDWKKTHFLTNEIRKKNIRGILSIVPTLTSLFIHFDLLIIDRTNLLDWINRIIEEINDKEIDLKSKHYKIPLAFGGEYGPDFDLIAEEVKKSKEELIQAITSQPNRILCFSRGPMMESPINKSVKRVSSPRPSVPAGTLGIAFGQISISSMDAPSGWKMLGQSPTTLFDHTAEPPGILNPGDYLEFFAIEKDEYEFYKLKHIEGMDVDYE
ncbi:5-oxoprolinase subunit B family protein [Oceanobacillus alkalisoli]|uniref:5-oxoprolinase subunit B family protein n=1 Tax=Oceanobacillus alkalisoli TaxID=2925113 RepID=UPI001EE41CA8|nr:carboxyltransferase domain-containing protein [Oceanobacillus alkalisoli]MCG5103226.1 carboxyltransferase domain-containing protein [Oceanobacillus alkalisoli]